MGSAGISSTSSEGVADTTHEERAQMSLHPLPRDLWRALCAFLDAHENCQVIVNQHQWRVVEVQLVGIRERVKAGQGDIVHVGDMPAYAVPSRALTKT